MINKELLSKVLDNEVPYQVKVHKIIIKNNSLNYFYNSKDSGGGLFEANEYINIYELAHKCKEWTSINSYALESSVHMQPKRSSVAGCQIHWRYETEDLPYFEADTEPEAIFKACEWILTKDSK